MKRSHILWIHIIVAASLQGCGADNPSTASSASSRQSPSQTTSSFSPLATQDQLDLDSFAQDIDQRYKSVFAATRSQALLACTAARAQPPSPEALSRLELAMDELQFASIQKVINSDVNSPKVYWVNSPPRVWHGDVYVKGSRYSYDNPDNIYRLIPIDGNASYRIHGQRFGNGPIDVTFSLINNENTQGTIAILTGKDLVVENDGSYVIEIDPEPANGRKNHIRSTPQAVQLFVRNNLGDWTTETPDKLRAERVGGLNGEIQVSEQTIVQRSLRSFQEAIVAYCVGALGVKTHLSNQVNTLRQPVQSDSLGTLTTQANTFGHFKLTEDEALVVTVGLGGARYFVLPVSDPWMITVDPARQTNSLNNLQSKPNRDGSISYVISAKDPGVWNWINTGGLLEGTMFLRWQGLPETSSSVGRPSVQVFKTTLDELRNVLPAETVWVDDAQRKSQLSERHLGYQRRIASPDETR